MYIGIGKRSKWDDESNPPAENAAATSLDDTIGYKLVTRKFAARPYEDGDDSSMVVTISSDDNYTLLADNDPTIWTAPATFLYCEVNITIEETNIISFRESGLFAGLTTTNTPGDFVLPSQVNSTGSMLSIANFPAVNITPTSSATIGFIYSFKPVVI